MSLPTLEKVVSTKRRTLGSIRTLDVGMEWSFKVFARVADRVGHR